MLHVAMFPQQHAARLSLTVTDLSELQNYVVWLLMNLLKYKRKN